MITDPEEQLKFLMEEFPHFFSLKNIKGDMICDDITFPNVLIKIEEDEYDEKHIYITLFMEINIPFKCDIDLDYLKNNDYALYFNDNKQERIFKTFVQSYIIAKKIDNFGLMGTAWNFSHKLEHSLSCYILCGFGSFKDFNNMKVYKDAIDKRKKKCIPIKNRFEIMDI